MKTLLIFLTAFLFASVVYSQDTLHMKNRKQIPCKVTEIGIDEIKYKDWDNLDGPVIVVRKLDVLKIVYQNGKISFIEPDEMAANKEEQIIDKNQAIEVSFLSPLFSHLELTYERKLEVGKNLEISAGFIGINSDRFSSYSTFQGGYFRGGLKFLLGQDFYINGMRYVHPLKGRYIKPELSFSIVDFSHTSSVNSYNTWNYDYAGRASLVTLNIVYGRQFILGNIMTFEYFVGAGYGLMTTKYTKGSRDYGNYWGNFGGPALVVSNEFPLAVTAGIRIGGLFK